MRDEDGHLVCDWCGKLASLGFSLVPHGTVNAGALEVGTDSRYCSATCLRNAALKVAPGEDPVAVLGRRVMLLEQRLKESDALGIPETGDDRIKSAFVRISDTIGVIREGQLTRAISTDDRGKHLSRCITAIEKVLANAEEADPSSVRRQ